MRKQNKRNTKKFKKKRNKANSVNGKLQRENTKSKIAPNSIGDNLTKKRAINFTLKSDGKDTMKSFFVYSNELISELKQHNKKTKTTSQSSVDIFLENILPQGLAFVQDRLNIGNANPLEVQKKIVGELMYGLGSICMANPYWSVWGSMTDCVFDINIDIDEDGYVGVNQIKGNSEHQTFMLRKGIQSKYTEIKNDLNLVSFS